MQAVQLSLVFIEPALMGIMISLGYESKLPNYPMHINVGTYGFSQFEVMGGDICARSKVEISTSQRL